MPLFFMISGYFLPNGRSPKAFFIKKSKRLLVPYLVTILCGIALKSISSLIYGNPGRIHPDAADYLARGLYASGGDGYAMFGLLSVGPLWFIPASLISSGAVYYLISKVKSYAAQSGIVIAVFLICQLTARRVFLPFSLQPAGCAMIFVYSGWHLKKHLPELFKVHAGIRCFVLTLVYLGAVFFEYCIKGTIVPAICRYPYPVLSVSFGIAISCGVILASSHLSRLKSVGSALCFLGRNSLTILCVHYLSLVHFPPINTMIAWSGRIHPALTYPTYNIIEMLLCVGSVGIAHYVRKWRQR